MRVVTPTNGNLLFFRPRSFFGWGIAFFAWLKHRRGPIYSHVALVVDGKKYEAMEGKRTGFRKGFGKCYVYEVPFLHYHESHYTLFKEYALSQKGTKYDWTGIFSFIVWKVPLLKLFVRQNDFENYCSELAKDALVDCDQESRHFYFLKEYEIISPSKLAQELLKHNQIKLLWINLK
jgi:hypothetical protein